MTLIAILTRKKKINKWVSIILFTMSLVCVEGFRYGVETDFGHYYGMFKQMSAYKFIDIFNLTTMKLGNTERVFIFFMTSLINVLYTLKKYLKAFPFSVYLYICLYYQYMQNYYHIEYFGISKGVKKMEKILFFIPTLGGGGAEKVLVNLVNNLDKNKYNITVQTLFDYGVNKQYLNEDIKYKYVFKCIFRGNKHLFKLFSPRFLFKCMVKENYDVIVSYLEGPTTRIASGCTNSETKLIAWVHTEMKSLKDFTSSYRNVKEMKKVYDRYDSIVFVANIARKAFAQHFNKNKLFIIQNTIDTQDILNKSKDPIKIKEVNFKKPILCTVGRLTRVKGYERLLKIHKRIISEGMQHTLWILGEGEDRKKLQEYIKNNNLENSVLLLGYQENPYKYLSKADIYICSSYIEGYNTAVVEAVVLGKPIVTTRCSGMNEILDNGKYGMIVENDDEKLYEGIKKMLLNKDLLNEYKKLSCERKEYFSIENQIGQVEKQLNK